MRGSTPRTSRNNEATGLRSFTSGRLSKSYRRSVRHGFTIVELLIVVVVLAILAAIALVSYNGITNQANDSARLADASTIEKALQLHVAEHGWSTGVNDVPGAREGVLAIFGLEGIANRVHILGLDGEGGSEPDRSKVYMRIKLNCTEGNDGNNCSVPWGVNGIDYAYWSNADNVWHNVEGSGQEDVYRSINTAEEGPFGMGDDGPV